MRQICVLGVAAAGLIFAGAAGAATINVNSISALQGAINGASPGDTIVVANGTYTTSGRITITRQGTASAPITVIAQSPLGVTIAGSGGFQFSSPGAYFVIQGFRLTHASGTTGISSGAHHNRFTRNVFQEGSGSAFFNLSGDDNQLDHNTFQNKAGLGQMISMTGGSNGMCKRNWIHHNYFHDQTPGGGNGSEGIRAGLSGVSLTDGFNIFEYNLFERMDGENELISNKSCANTYRYNTFRDCPAQFTLRHGNRCLVYGNYFINTPGIRIFGDDHKIFSNHFSSSSIAIQIGNGDGEVADGAALTSHDRPDRVEISFNTLVNNSRNITMDGRTNGLGATSTTIANNIIEGGPTAMDVVAHGPFPNPHYEGNIVWQTSRGDIPSSAARNVDPMLSADSRGAFHLLAGSPAIDTASGTYGAVTVDMDGQARVAPKDVGADEVSGEAVRARPILPAEVGPGSDLGATPTPTPTSTPTLTPTPTPTSTPTPTPTGNPTTPPADVEVTPGAAAVTASTNDGNVPGNVVDNNLTTRWSALGDPQWIKLDLGSVRTVTRARIAVYNGNTRQNRFDLQVSTDNTNWTNALTGALSSGTTTQEEDYDLGAQPARYVRYFGHGSTDPTKLTTNSVTEISVFALPPTSTPTPTPVPSYVEVTPGAAAVSASTNDGNLPGNVVDNNLATRWSANGDGQWLQLDLGSVRTVGYVNVAVYNGNTRSNIFELQLSTGDGNWTTVFTGQSNGTTTGEQKFDFNDLDARLVRYVGHMNTVNTFNSVTEISVFALP
jgi:hypothetical protein